MNKAFLALLLMITLFGFTLRYRNIGQIPLPGQSQDEYSNAWVGLSIIETGMPLGMSGLSGNLNQRRIYINPDRIFQQTASGDPMTIAYPWFDHPPLVGLITGGFSYLKGVRIFEDVSASVVRKPAVAFSVLTIFMIGLLGKAWFSGPAGLLAALFYAISPLTTITNRMVQAENFFTPMVLISLYCWWTFTKRKKKVWWYLGSIAIMTAVLMKLSVVAFVIAGIVLLRENYKQKWPFIMMGVFALAAFSWWAIYGAALSAGSFWAVLFSNSHRAYGIGYQAVSDLLTTVKVTGQKTITDGWVLASFLGFMALAVSEAKNKRWLVAPLMFYLAIYLFFGSESYGWYRLPFFPFTFIALGYFTVELWKKGELSGILLFLIPLGISATKVFPTAGSWLLLWRALPIASLLVGYFVNSRKLNRLILTVFILAAVIVSLVYNLKIDITTWYQLS